MFFFTFIWKSNNPQKRNDTSHENPPDSLLFQQETSNLDSSFEQIQNCRHSFVSIIIIFKWRAKCTFLFCVFVLYYVFK